MTKTCQTTKRIAPCFIILLYGFSLLLSSLFCSTSFAARDWPLKLIETSPLPKPLRKSVIIAIIDTGIDTANPVLSSLLWQNPGESGKDANGQDRSTNGKDDDLNGFVDDTNGWNFVTSTAQLKDTHGHGTHVAGIIASVASGSFPPKESQTGIKLMILKYFEPEASPYATMNNTVQAIHYAIRNGADVINYSGGGLNPNAVEKAALLKASEAGILVVAAAGNESANSDITGYYPANYNLPNILSVGAISAKKQIIESSNFGAENVDLVAPGEDIPSTLPDKTFGLMTGTSQATAFASAVAALVLVERPDRMRPENLIAHLTQTSAYAPNLQGKIKSASILNLKRSLQMSFTGEFANQTSVTNYTARTENYLSQLNRADPPGPTTPEDFRVKDDRHWSQALISELSIGTPR